MGQESCIIYEGDILEGGEQCPSYPSCWSFIAFFITQSMAVLNRTADITHPCLTPDFTLNVIPNI